VKVAVLVKRVPDTACVFTVAGDGKSVEMDRPQYVMSPYDEHAVEEAMKLKEAHGAEVVVVSAGPAETKETIRSALAMGADSAVLATGDGVEDLTPRGTAHVLAAVLKDLAADVVLAGKQAVDNDASQVPERTAELLGLPHVSSVVRLELGDGRATAVREIEGGHQTLETPLPAVFTAQKGLNEPRYPTLPNIMKAKKKEIREVALSDLGLSDDVLAPGLVVEAMALPRQDRLGKILEGDPAQQAQELVRALREEEKVL